MINDHVQHVLFVWVQNLSDMLIIMFCCVLAIQTPQH